MNKLCFLNRFGLSVALLAAWTNHALAAPGANSCLIPNASKSQVKQAAVEEADQRYAVLRPCEGKVTGQAVEIIYSVGDGITNRTQVPPNSLIKEHLSRAEQRPLVDIWPSRSLLATAFAFAQGKRTSTSGLSGFDGKNGGLPVQGDLVLVPDLKLHLKVHGLDPATPVRFSQGKWSKDVAPDNGIVSFPVNELKPGELTLTQGTRNTKVTVLAPKDAAEVLQQLKSIEQSTGSDTERSIRRAVMFQENELSINALSDYLATRKEGQ